MDTEHAGATWVIPTDVEIWKWVIPTDVGISKCVIPTDVGISPRAAQESEIPTFVGMTG